MESDGRYKLSQSSFSLLEALDQVQREAFEGVPAWATAAFAIAVFSGTLACIELLLRKKWARILFMASLIAAVVQFVHWLFISNAVEAFRPSSYRNLPDTLL